MEVLQDTVLPETDPVLSRDSLTRLRHEDQAVCFWMYKQHYKQVYL